MKIVDLSPPVSQNSENLVYPGHVYSRIIPILDYRNNLIMSSNVEIWLHAGAHVDAPVHALKNGASIESLGLDTVVREAVLLDLTKCGDREITRTDLEAAESSLSNSGEKIVTGDLIVLRTDWSLTRRPWTPEYRKEAPYLSADAAEWLVDKRPSAIGFDFPEEKVDLLQKSLSGKPAAHPLPIHYKLLSAGIILVEHLTNLNQLKETRFLLVAAPLNIVGAEGSPVRAFAIERQHGSTVPPT